MSIKSPIRDEPPKHFRLHYLALQATAKGQASYSHVHEIIVGLKRRGWRVELHEPDYANHSNPSIARRLWQFVRVQGSLVSQLRRNRSALYVRSHFAAWPTAAFARLRGISVIQEMNGPYEDAFVVWPSLRPFVKLVRAMVRSQLRWASGIVTNTDGLAAWITREVGMRTTRTIPNGANTGIFHPNASTDFPLPTRFVVFFGAFSRWQGIDIILRALQSERWPKDVHIVFAGDGQLRTTVEAAASEDERVHYLGVLSQTDLAGVVARSIAGLCPKLPREQDETGWSPLKVYEILACGVPAIVTNLPGQVEILLEEDCGLVIPPNDPDALATAVLELAENDESRRSMGMRGAAVVRSHHSWDARAAETDEFLRDILGHAAR